MLGRPKSVGIDWRPLARRLLAGFAGAALILVSSGIGLASQSQFSSSAKSPQPEDAQASGAQTSGQQEQAAAANSKPSHLPRGKKLILKDGSVQLVREYQVMGDKVRFYSTERSQWEEMPAALVDWDATNQVVKDQKKGDTELLAKVHTQEQIRRVMPLDVDASLEAAPGVFVPPGEGLFVYDGKSVLRLTQAQADNRRDKTKALEQVLVPIPVVPSRRNLSIPRPHAEVRVHNQQPEFYMRTADLREPEMLLIRTKVRSDSRFIENVDTYLSAINKTKRDEVFAQRWQIAKGVYRFTISESLAPGEYVFTEIVKGEGTNLYVWDFGVDAPGKSRPAAKPAEK
ncbi:MAG: hypothetical protein ACRD59_18885 [Candidatus Acidiferrales bacterium]